MVNSIHIIFRLDLVPLKVFRDRDRLKMQVMPLPLRAENARVQDVIEKFVLRLRYLLKHSDIVRIDPMGRILPKQIPHAQKLRQFFHIGIGKKHRLDRL